MRSLTTSLDDFALLSLDLRPFLADGFEWSFGMENKHAAVSVFGRFYIRVVSRSLDFRTVMMSFSWHHGTSSSRSSRRRRPKSCSRLKGTVGRTMNSELGIHLLKATVSNFSTRECSLDTQPTSTISSNHIQLRIPKTISCSTRMRI